MNSRATETYITYAPETDMTFIMKQVIDAATLEAISDECVGWVFGKISLSEALNIEPGLKAEYLLDTKSDLIEADCATVDKHYEWLWQLVHQYVDRHVEPDKQDEVAESLFDDDDFCNDLFRCNTEGDVETLLDNRLK